MPIRFQVVVSRVGSAPEEHTHALEADAWSLRALDQVQRILERYVRAPMMELCVEFGTPDGVRLMLSGPAAIASTDWLELPADVADQVKVLADAAPPPASGAVN